MADILRGFYNFFYDKETRKYQMCEISFESLKYVQVKYTYKQYQNNNTTYVYIN